MDLLLFFYKDTPPKEFKNIKNKLTKNEYQLKLVLIFFLNITLYTLKGSIKNDNEISKQKNNLPDTIKQTIGCLRIECRKLKRFNAFLKFTTFYSASYRRFCHF